MRQLLTILLGLRPVAPGWPGRVMKREYLLIIPAVLVWIAWQPVCTCGAEAEGVAVAIVFDTSGSMSEPARDGGGGMSPKYKIATRSLQAVTDQLQAYANSKSSSEAKKLYAGLFVFEGSGAREAVKFGPFDGGAIKNWARGYSRPSGGTPLGTAVETASQAVLNSGLTRKHVLVITDGMNTIGQDPAQVMPRLKKQADAARASLSFHFVAFDVNAKVFDSVKKLGATVLGASDEKQLNTQLDFILQRKILLEDEEPVKK